MLFSKKKKLQRDRKAGLVFRWRGGYAANRGGSTIAFLVTSFVFVAGFVLLNVYAKPNTVPSRYRASMIQLGAMDDDLDWWVEKNSPYLPSWSENRKQESDSRVNALLTEEVRESYVEAYHYEDVEMQQIEIGDEGIYTMTDRSLPSVARFDIGGAGVPSKQDTPPLNWGLKLNVDGVLKTRLPDAEDLPAYGEWIPLKWRGRSVSYIVAVDVKGKVLIANPAEWSEEKAVRDFKNWIHTIPFKPAPNEGGQTAMGVIEVVVSPVMMPKEKVKEEQQ